MGYEAKKTEHAGAKHGNGAYWGYKWEAKKESNRVRRENWKSAPPLTPPERKATPNGYRTTTEQIPDKHRTEA
jgi:hypothetical protein